MGNARSCCTRRFRSTFALSYHQRESIHALYVRLEIFFVDTANAVVASASCCCACGVTAVAKNSDTCYAKTHANIRTFSNNVKGPEWWATVCCKFVSSTLQPSRTLHPYQKRQKASDTACKQGKEKTPAATGNKRSGGTAAGPAAEVPTSLPKTCCY